MRYRRNSATALAAAALAAATVLAAPAAPAATAAPPARAAAAATAPALPGRFAPPRAEAPAEQYLEYTVAIDEIEVRGTLDPVGLGITNTTYVRVPATDNGAGTANGTGTGFSWKATPTVTGNLADGVTSNVRLPDATGTVRLHLAGDEVLAAVDITVAGRHSRWDRALFTL